ncbi:outer membrane protein assembly factor BamD, partial [Treponema sp. R6D11]
TGYRYTEVMILSAKKLHILAISAFVLCVSACASTADISDDITPAEIIQRAQEATDKNRYKLALQYYQALKERNPSNIDLVITAEYEIAFIHYKQNKFQQAKGELNDVLEYYNTPDEELLPQHFKKLSKIVIERIEKREKKLGIVGS